MRHLKTQISVSVEAPVGDQILVIQIPTVRLRIQILQARLKTIGILNVLKNMKRSAVLLT